MSNARMFGRRIRLALARIGLCSPPCLHLWRPARTSKSAARVCHLCDRVEELTEADFYARFGRISR